MAEIVVFGTVAADVVLRVTAIPRPGDHVGAERLGWRLGGSSANIAASLAGDGHRVELISVVGSDDLAASLLDELRVRGVGTRHCVRVAGLSPQALILVDPDGERTIIGLDRGSATDALPLQTLPDLPGPACVVVESYGRYPTWLAERWPGTLLVATPPPLDADHWPADIVVGSERQIPSEWNVDPFANAQRVAGRRLRWLVVTRGAQGADAYGPDGVIHTPVRPARQVDATGAGDAFAAGLITTLLTGGAIGEAMRVGAERGAAAVEAPRSAPLQPMFRDPIG